jgi:hypothetical protein
MQSTCLPETASQPLYAPPNALRRANLNPFTRRNDLQLPPGNSIINIIIVSSKQNHGQNAAGTESQEEPAEEPPTKSREGS